MRTSILALLLILSACAAPMPSSGIVVERVYTPSLDGTGWGSGSCTGVGTNGSVVTGTCFGTVHYSENEKWTLVMKAPDGTVWAEPVDPQTWALYDKGDTVSFDREN